MQTTRWVIPLLATAAMSLACGCGGSSGTSASSSQTTSPKSQPPVTLHWTRCSGGSYGMSVAGISCRAAEGPVLISKNSTGGAESIRKSDPRVFRSAGFDCTQFPLEDGSGWHVICDRASQHMSFYFTP
jgi:hypothetical protein